MFHENFLVKYFSDIHTLSISILLLCISILLKYSIKRRKYSKLIPSLNTRFIDILGNFGIFLKSKEFYKSTDLKFTSVLFQVVCGLSCLFKKEVLWIFWLGYTPFVFLHKPEAVEDVLIRKNIIEKAWFYRCIQVAFGTGLVTSTGQKWKSRRKLLTPAFHFDILKAFVPTMNNCSMTLVKILQKETTKEFTSMVPPLTLCSLDIICQTVLGVDFNCQEDKEAEIVKVIERLSERFMARIMNPLGWFDFTFFHTYGRKDKKDLKFLHNFTMFIINEKKKKMMVEGNSRRKRKALMDILLEHHIQTKELSEEDIRDEVTTFVTTGYDTGAFGLSWMLYFIGLYKDVQAKIHEEIDEIFGNDKEREITIDDLKDMKYLECVIKESLRLCPSAPLLGRQAEKDMEICGYPIPKGTAILIMPYMVHRDENQFPNPEVFDPNRFTPENSAKRHPYAYIPFLVGSRDCIGQRFALIEEKIIVANVLRNFKIESLDPRDKVVTVFEIILKPSEIRMKIYPR